MPPSTISPATISPASILHLHHLSHLHRPRSLPPPPSAISTAFSLHHLSRHHPPSLLPPNLLRLHRLFSSIPVPHLRPRTSRFLLHMSTEQYMYVDESFPPHIALPLDLPQPATWIRYSELWPRESLPPAPAAISEPEAIVQGALGDCWLLAPLIGLAARHPDRVRDLFRGCVPSQVREEGRATLRFFVLGGWQEVTIDTLLPCDDERRPLYCGRHGAGWAALLEKAYAKLRGSYGALHAGGRSLEALVDLTGGVAERHAPRDAIGAPRDDGEDESERKAAEAALLLRMRRWLERGHLLCCSQKEAAEAAAHAHCVLEVAAPRGEICARVRDPSGVGSARDSWHSYADFVARFDRVAVCFLPSDAAAPRRQPHAAALSLRHSERLDELRGGTPAGARWCLNPQWRLRAPRKARVIVAFAQSEQAHLLRREAPASCVASPGVRGGCLLLDMRGLVRKRVAVLSILCPEPEALKRRPSRPAEFSDRIWCIDKHQLLCEAGPSNQRELTLTFSASAAVTYVIAPHLAHPSAGRFLLRVFSDHPCAIDPLPRLVESPPHVAAWDASTAGGRTPAASWAANPQFALCAPRGTRALLLLERCESEAGGGGGRAYAAAEAVGLTVVDASSGGAARAEGGVAVLSGMNGDVRAAGGGVLYAAHPALLLSESTLDEKGFAGAAGGWKRRGGGRRREGAAREEGSAEEADALLRRVRRLHTAAAEDVRLEEGFHSAAWAHGLLSIAALAPLVVVPSTQASGQHGRFRLTLLSEAPVAIRQLPAGFSASAAGEWRRISPTRNNAGGCRSESTWGCNPQEEGQVMATGQDGDTLQEVTVKVSLTRPEKAWAAALRNPTRVADAMLGLCILLDHRDVQGQRAELRGRLDAPGSLRLIHETCFGPSCELSSTLQIQLPSWAQLLLIPSTFSPGQFGPFNIAVHSDCPVDLQECV
ncbi:hypothetical protein AB1Y20_006917 [Prymnesium parvum]|uniref:Calpain catalytic domain-containing protein n=1 Tax=Prymnesium parvum TaxID=97485 RepID=A0AB34J097_PRYPA